MTKAAKGTSSTVVPIRGEGDDAGTEFKKKWGPKVAERGFCMVPSLLLKAQLRLGLSAQELNVMLHLMDHWWRADSRPWPSQATLAQRMNIQPRQVRRILNRLRAAGLVDWEARYKEDKGRLSNAYDLSGLVKKLKKLGPRI
ncbi:helix-turn-helix domain-containing protein [Arhodomonas sp. AD133]|uniref:helix-turn-helix domain-containing protein n=1 Tax=Arhodomonas sp. AD133 TaxID=3415009 RepID=UPI003EB90D72